MIWVLIVVALIFAGAWYFSKWNSKFKLLLIFGKKGSGKSTLLVKWMMQYHKKGYCIYTNMKSVTLDYVIHIDEKDVGDYVGIPNSVLLLDECGTWLDNRKFKTFKDSMRDYFIYQRQYRNIVILASQNFNVDKKVRELVDKMYLCGKIGPISYARPIRRNITLTEPMGDSESRIADQLVFAPGVLLTWIPRYARLFESFAPPEKPFFVGSPSIEEIQSGATKKSFHRLQRQAGSDGKFLVGAKRERGKRM